MSATQGEVNVVGAAFALAAIIIVFALWFFGAIETDLAVQLEIFWLAVLAGMLGYQMSQIQGQLNKLRAEVRDIRDRVEED